MLCQQYSGINLDVCIVCGTPAFVAVNLLAGEGAKAAIDNIMEASGEHKIAIKNADTLHPVVYNRLVLQSDHF